MPKITWRGTNGQNFTPGRDDHQPLAIVNHVMMGTLAGTRSAFCDPDHKASAHFGVGLNGDIDQYVDVANMAWGNGPVRNPNLAAVSWIADLCIRLGINPNLLTIIIEWEGTHTGGYWENVTWQGKTYSVWRPGPKAHYFQPTEAQYQAGLWLHQQLIPHYNIALDRAHICRHSDFDNVVKPFCPGANWPMPRLLHDLGVEGF